MTDLVGFGAVSDAKENKKNEDDDFTKHTLVTKEDEFKMLLERELRNKVRTMVGVQADMLSSSLRHETKGVREFLKRHPVGGAARAEIPMEFDELVIGDQKNIEKTIWARVEGEMGENKGGEADVASKVIGLGRKAWMTSLGFQGVGVSTLSLCLMNLIPATSPLAALGALATTVGLGLGVSARRRKNSLLEEELRGARVKGRLKREVVGAMRDEIEIAGKEIDSRILPLLHFVERRESDRNGAEKECEELRQDLTVIRNEIHVAAGGRGGFFKGGFRSEQFGTKQ